MDENIKDGITIVERSLTNLVPSMSIECVHTVHRKKKHCKGGNSGKYICAKLHPTRSCEYDIEVHISAAHFDWRFAPQNSSSPFPIH